MPRKTIISLSILLALTLVMGETALGQDKWDSVLDRYERITAQCQKLRESIVAGKAVPDKEVTRLLGELSTLRNTLQEASGKMTPKQKERFRKIRDSYPFTSSAARAPEPVEGPQGPVVRLSHQPAITAPEQSLRAAPVVPEPVEVGEVVGWRSRPEPLPNITTKILFNHLLPRPESLSPRPPQEHIPAQYSMKTDETKWKSDILGLIDFGDKPSYGIFASTARNSIGGFLSARSNFQPGSSSYSCLSDGSIPEGRFWGNGSSRISALAASGGFVWTPLSQSSSFRGGLYAGAGYGRSILLWQDVEDDWAKVEDASREGVLIEAGVLAHFRGFSLLAGGSLLRGEVHPVVGIGISF